MNTDTEKVDFYKETEAQIKEKQTVREINANIKMLQKQAINFQQYRKERALQLTEEKLEILEAELDEIPIVQEFKQSQIEVNNLLQLVSSAISNKVTDEILISTGGDLLTGETGSQLKNNPSSCQ